MFLFTILYFPKTYFSRVKMLVRAYELLHKTVFNQRDIRIRVVLANTVEVSF